MPTYPNPESLNPFRSNVPSDQQCKVGDKIVRVKDPFNEIPIGTICIVEGASIEKEYVELAVSNLACFLLSNFAPLPPEEKTFDTLTLGELESGEWRVKSDGTGAVYNIKIAVIEFTRNGKPAGLCLLDDLKNGYTLLPPEPIKTISKEEAEKMLNAKIVN